MGAVPVSEGIWWVGGVDWNLRDFHGFETPRGTTYNAYLVKGETGWALVDTVKTPFVDECLRRIASVVDPAEISWIVVNHVEPDHNSGLPATMAALPNARVVASVGGTRAIPGYHRGLVAEPVGVDDVIDLGGRTLRFLPAMMVHWPDSMFTYCPEERVLMPNDAFGQHLATSGRFADEVGMDVAIHELGVYFANILLPLTAQVTKTLGRMAEVGWEPEIVAPSHGVIWRGADQIEAASEAYAGWLAQETCEKLLVVYSTMWGSTELAARAIAEGAAEEGVTTKLYDLACTAYSTILFELLDARTIALGSPTLHHTMLYRVGGFLTYLEGLKPEGRLAATFGSYGWGGGAIKAMRPWLERIGFTLYDADFGIKFKPADEELAAAREWGRALARATKEHPGAPTVGR